MRGALGVSRQAPSEAEKNAALEALAHRRPLSAAQARTLSAVGWTPRDRPSPTARPWDQGDAVLVRRLAGVRGWSPTAIATFVQRPEAQIREMLGSGLRV